MTKVELEKKSLAELHSLAAEAGVERFRVLTRGELIAKLAGDSVAAGDERPSRGRGEQQERPARRRRRSGARGESGGRERSAEAPRESRAVPERAPEREPAPELPPRVESAATPANASESGQSRPRRRRRRRFGRRGKQGITLQDLLLPVSGRQALLYAESREACTALLRGVAADLAAESKGPDPIALLIDPSPEELADWRREAPQAEIVAAGQPRHASDALAQASTRASGGDEVILLVDSLTRLAEAYGDADAAKQFFDAAGGNLTVVAALERPAAS